MPKLMEAPPYAPIEPVTEIVHGVPVSDPYRWLEDQNSARTRDWLAAQHSYARSYLDAIPERERIGKRVRELLDVETHDCLQKVGIRYFFQKRMPRREQACIFCRDGIDGKDELLIDPAEQGTGKYTAVRPLRVSRDGRSLLYEVKEGGERTGRFELLDVATREVLPDTLPRGYLRGFAFGRDAKSFYYVHQLAEGKESRSQSVYLHVLGTEFKDDREIYCSDHTENMRVHLVPGQNHVGILVFRYGNSTLTDFYLVSFDDDRAAEPLIKSAAYKFGPVLLGNDRILAITDLDAPNFRIVEVQKRTGQTPKFLELVSAAEVPIQNWVASEERIFVSYLREMRTEIEIFDTWGNGLKHLPFDRSETVRMTGASESGDELLLEHESFIAAILIESYSTANEKSRLWAERKVPFNSDDFAHTQVWFHAKDGTRIPMYLAGRREVLAGGAHPTIMTSYGGYGVSMTPQFSAFVAFMMERGCLFALPNIRGGSEFGLEWHEAAKRQNRQVAFDDFLSAAEWLVESGRTDPKRLAIFGGSNSGLLVGAAMTQWPDLFRAVVCMVPILDMIRYHLFDGAGIWKEEYGTADDPKDFAALFGYSPYHKVRDGLRYPATLIVSGDSDQNCNALHARKMTARLQAANRSDRPILLDYDPHRGHSPVLPLSTRIGALTDRLAFLCDQLELMA